MERDRGMTKSGDSIAGTSRHRGAPVKRVLALVAAFALLLAGCAAQKYDSEREWRRGECNKVIDKDDRERCLKRVEGR